MSRPNLGHMARKDKDMYDMYTKLSEVKQNGIHKYTHQWVMDQLVQRFYLEPETIMARIKRHARNRDAIPGQLRIELPM